MTVSAEFEFSATEHRRASAAVLRQLPSRWVFPLAGVVILALNGFRVLTYWGEYPASALFMSILPWLLVSALFVAFMPLMSWVHTRRIVKSDPSIRGLQRRVVDATGFHSSGNGVVLDLPWHAMARCAETDEFFLFFYAGQLAYYLGKSHLSAAEIASVRSLIDSHCPGFRAA